MSNQTVISGGGGQTGMPPAFMNVAKGNIAVGSTGHPYRGRPANTTPLERILSTQLSVTDPKKIYVGSHIFSGDAESSSTKRRLSQSCEPSGDRTYTEETGAGLQAVLDGYAAGKSSPDVASNIKKTFGDMRRYVGSNNLSHSAIPTGCGSGHLKEVAVYNPATGANEKTCVDIPAVHGATAGRLAALMDALIVHTPGAAGYDGFLDRLMAAEIARISEGFLVATGAREPADMALHRQAFDDAYRKWIATRHPAASWQHQTAGFPAQYRGLLKDMDEHICTAAARAIWERVAEQRHGLLARNPAAVADFDVLWGHLLYAMSNVRLPTSHTAGGIGDATVVHASPEVMSCQLRGKINGKNLLTPHNKGWNDLRAMLVADVLEEGTRLTNASGTPNISCVIAAAIATASRFTIRTAVTAQTASNTDNLGLMGVKQHEKAARGQLNDPKPAPTTVTPAGALDSLDKSFIDIRNHVKELVAALFLYQENRVQPASAPQINGRDTTSPTRYVSPAMNFSLAKDPHGLVNDSVLPSGRQAVLGLPSTAATDVKPSAKLLQHTTSRVTTRSLSVDMP